jgi:hypothetical protein
MQKLDVAMSLTRPIALVSVLGLLSCGAGAAPTNTAQSDTRDRSSTTRDEASCDRFQVTAFADLKTPRFGVLLREYDFRDGTEHPKVLRSYVFPETQAEFDFRVSATSVYCELQENSLFIYGRGYNEGGDVVFRIRLDTSSWKYDFSSVRVSDEPT